MNDSNFDEIEESLLQVPANGRRYLQQDKPRISGTINLSSLESYCMKLLTWEEAKPIVDMVEKIYGIDPPPNVKMTICRIKRYFNQKIYGQAFKVKKVVMKAVKIGAWNKITKNRNVNIDKDYEE